MESTEKKAYACHMRDMCLDNANMSIKRAAELESEYTRLEVQIAAILFAFSVVFVEKFGELSARHPGVTADTIKIMYAVGIFMLIVSLAMGLLHLKRTAKFWESFIEMRNARYLKWNETIMGSISFEEALAFHQGVSLGKVGLALSPVWTWVLQTVCLGMAVLLFLLFSWYFSFSQVAGCSDEHWVRTEIFGCSSRRGRVGRGAVPSVR